MHAGRLAYENLERYGDYTSLYFQENRYTNRQRLEYAQRLAAVFKEHGVMPGDRVVVMMKNCPAVTAAFQAGWIIGAVIMPIMPQLLAREVNYMIEHAGAKVVLTSPTLASVVRDATQNIADFEHLLLIGESDADGTTNITTSIDSASPIDSLQDRAPNDLAMLIYTSGTTGKPKGVMLSHENVVANSIACSKVRKTDPFTRFLFVLPLAHCYGVLMMNLANLAGSITYLLPHFDAKIALQHIERFHIQRISVVPTMLSYLINEPNRSRHDVSSLQHAHSGGAPLPNELRLQFESLFDCKMTDGYGQSEAAPSIAGYYEDDTFRPGSVGRAIPEVTVCIKDDQNHTLPPEQVGEICARGPNVMPGYWRNKEATEQTIVDGWLHTGDVGYMDADGFVYITDRKKDLIVKGGENISPREIEEVIYQYPGVAEVGVIGIPDSTFGEELCAVVSLKAGTTATQEQIREHTAKFITKFKLPAHVMFLDDLPKSSVGKILKRKLKSQILPLLEAIVKPS